MRAHVIRQLLLGAAEAEPGSVPGVRLRGARVVGRLDLAGASIPYSLTCEWRRRPGANVTAWTCHGGPNQIWHAIGDGAIVNGSNPSLCLDAAAHNGGVGAGANVTARPCNGGLNQKWFIGSAGDIRNFSNDRLCLDAAAPKGSVASGARVTAWPCPGGPNQKWG